MPQGTVISLRLDRGFGFIVAAGPISLRRGPKQRRAEIFFHAQDCRAELPFDGTLQERFVEFELVQTPRGPQAKNVRPAL